MSTFTQAPDLSETAKTALCAYHPLLQQLLFSRGITTVDDAAAFLSPSFENDLHDPFLLHDMEKAVARMLSAQQSGEMICVYGDYDCDGIPGVVVFNDYLRAIGHTAFMTYIPHRHYEGFGLNVEAVQKLHAQGVTLIITIDCGTSDFAAIEAAESLGIDVIVTDHHEPKETLPCAYAVVNPKVGTTYPFDGLCGSGVVFKCIQALLQRTKQDGSCSLADGQEKWWLDMVGLATIADMVPLIGENRALAHYGLKVLRKTRRPGLVHLLRKQNMSPAHVGEDDIGFTIGPRINAASRMDAPEDAFVMLSSTDEAIASAHVAHLEKLNNERKGIVAAMTKEAKKRIASKDMLPDVLVLGDPLWRPSLAGLLANTLAQEFGRPAFVWGRDGREAIRGSCRSEGRSSVVALMDAVPDIFSEYGGHHMSGGFGVLEDKIHTFADTLNTAHASLGGGVVFEAQTQIDATLTLDEVDRDVLTILTTLAPYGMGNPKPLFLFEHVVPEQVAIFGKTKEHTKLTFKTKGHAKEAIAFFTLPESFSKLPRAGEPLSLYGHIEQSYFMGRMQTRIRIVDIV